MFGCTNCSWKIENYSAPRTADRSFDINIRTVYACTGAGLGLKKIQDVFCGLDMPKPFSKASYANLLRKVNSATKCKSEKSMVEAANDVREKLKVNDENEMCQCNVMLDGTWMKRGHSSRYGVVSAISADNTKVIDVAIKSSVCNPCKKRENMDKESVAYLSWYADHLERGQCKRNHQGSAPIMEMNGVSDIFRRSRATRKLEYTGYIGDGDSKSYLNVCKENVYGKEIVKKVCRSRSEEMWSHAPRIEKGLWNPGVG